MEISKKNVVVFCPNIGGHRQNYSCFVSDWFLRSGYRVILAAGRTSEGQLASETPVIGGLERKWGELVLDLGDLNNSRMTYGGLVGTLREIEKRFSPEWTFFPTGNEIEHSLAGLGHATENSNVRRAAIFCRTDHVFKADLSYEKPLHRPYLLAKLEVKKVMINYYLRKLVWKRLGLHKAFSTNPYFLRAVRDVRFHYMPEIYRTWGIGLPEQQQEVDRLCMDLRSFLAKQPGKDVILYYGGWAARRGYDKLLHLVNLESDTIFVSYGRTTDCIQFRYDIHKMRDELRRQDRIFEVEVPFLPDSELVDLLYNSCNYVLLPYDGFYSQSGIMVQAAAYGKPVLVPSIGYMASSVKQFGIGLTYRNNDYSDFLRKFRLLRSTFLQYSENAKHFGRAFDRKKIDTVLAKALLS